MICYLRPEHKGNLHTALGSIDAFIQGRMAHALLQVLRLAMADANLAASEVSGIEMHGTGTALGDPIEIGALMAVFEGRLLSICNNTLLQDMQDVILMYNCFDTLL